MGKTQRVLVCGSSVALAGIETSLSLDPGCEVLSHALPISREELHCLAPDVVLFDLDAVPPSFVYTVSSELPGALLIGIDLETNPRCCGPSAMPKGCPARTLRASFITRENHYEAQQRILVVAFVALAALLLLIGTVSAGTPAGKQPGRSAAVSPAITPIPTAAKTNLPDYIGAAVKAHPLAPSRVPQNPSLAPNPFNYVHNDSWASDVYDIAGPLGRDPLVQSTTLAEARRNPNAPVFGCSGDVFDSNGRLILSCTGPGEWSLVMVDPETLDVLTSCICRSRQTRPVVGPRPTSTWTTWTR